MVRNKCWQHSFLILALIVKLFSHWIVLSINSTMTVVYIYRVPINAHHLMFLYTWHTGADTGIPLQVRACI